MASVNKVILIANLAQDPTVRYAASGSAITNMTVATNRQWKDRNTGEKKEEAEFHRVVLYDRLAEIAGEYLRKGSSCYVEGRLRTRKWQDKEGIDRYTTEIIAESMKLLGGRSDESAPRPAQSDGDYKDRRNKPYTTQPQSAPAPDNGPAGFDDMDDEMIPF